MTREDILASIKANVESKNFIKHMLATEAIMRALARRFGEDEDEWGLTGLVHDIDVELTEGELESHSKLGADLAKELGASERMTRAILCHNETHGIPPETMLDKALFYADSLTVLITIGALSQPDRKLARVSVSSLMKSLDDERLPARNREHIILCNEIGLELEDFIDLGLEAMKVIADELGL